MDLDGSFGNIQRTGNQFVAIAAGDQGIGKVRADETGTTGDESAHEVSLSFNGLPSVAFQEVLRKVRDG